MKLLPCTDSFKLYPDATDCTRDFPAVANAPDSDQPPLRLSYMRGKLQKMYVNLRPDSSCLKTASGLFTIMSADAGVSLEFAKRTLQE